MCPGLAAARASRRPASPYGPWCDAWSRPLLFPPAPSGDEVAQGRYGPCALAARSGRRCTGARGTGRPSAREVVALAGVDARRTWRPSRGVRGAAVTATSWGGGRVDDNGGRGGGPLQERRQIRCLIVFARTRTHREGILTPGRRRGQRPAAPPGPEMHQQRPASILLSPATCPVFRRRVATSPCRRRADAAAHSTLKSVTRAPF